MSQHSSTAYHNTIAVIPESDEENPHNPSSHSISFPSPPSSEEFSSDPTRFNQPVASGLDQALSKTSLAPRFQHPLVQLTPTSSKPPTNTDPVNNPPLSQITNNHTMNPTLIGVNALPIQGKRNAPRTFKGGYDNVEDFLKTMDRCFA
jgi:hypothetical protein